MSDHTDNLPCGWVIAPLDDFCEIVQGQSPPGDTYNVDRDGLPFFQGKAEFGELYPTAVKWCSSPTKIAEKEDVLISIRAPVGPTNLCPARACIGRGLAAVRPLGSISPRYVLYGLRNTQDELVARSTGSTFGAISGDTLRNHELPVAPLPEQVKIVEEIEKQFTRLEAGVAALKRVQANLKRYRAAVLKAAVEGRLVPTEAELARREGRSYETAHELLQRILAERRARWEADQLAKIRASGKPSKDDKWKEKYKEPEGPDANNLPSLPEGWAWATTSQIGEVQLGRQRSPKKRSKDYPTKYIRAANITEKGIDLSDVLDMEFDPDERQRYLLRKGDIVLSEASGSPTQVGKPAIWRDDLLPGCCFQNTVIRLRPCVPVSEYLLAVFKGFYWNGVFAKIAGGVGINHLGADKFSSVVVPLPPLPEQLRIVADVDRRLSVIEELEAQVEADLKRAGRLRQAVLKRAFEGKLVPQDPSDEPASVLLERIRAKREMRQGKAPAATQPRSGERRRRSRAPRRA